MLHNYNYNRDCKNHVLVIKLILPVLIKKLGKKNCKIIEEFSKPLMMIFDKLSPSTLTAQGHLTNVHFNEQDLIHAINPTGRIKKMTCNFGVVYSKDFKHPPKKKKNTNRGRKPKIKKKSVRKNQGNGMFFNSQITFWIQSLTIKDKYYKVKCFRNGTIEIPGGLYPSMSDVKDVANIVCKTIGDCLMEDVRIHTLYSIMRNYKFHTIDKDIRIQVDQKTIGGSKLSEHWNYNLNKNYKESKYFNPSIIPRNHIIENILNECKDGNYLNLNRFISYLNNPYNPDIPEEFMKEPTNEEKVYETFCGT